MNYVDFRIVNAADIAWTVLGMDKLPELRALRRRVREQRKQLRDLQRAYNALQWRLQLDLRGIK